MNNLVPSPTRRAPGMACFLWEFGKFAAIQGVILTLCLYIFFNYPRGNDPSAWGVEKRERLAAAPSPRLVMVGDSNVVLGINSQPIDEAFPAYHPVNAGLYAFLGHRMMLREIEDLIQPGDTVVVSWGYAHFAANEIQGLYYHYAVQRPESIRHFSWEETHWFMDHGMMLFKEAVRRTKKVLLRSKREPFGPPYGRDNLNEYGDGIGHYGMESPPGTNFVIKDFHASPNGYTGKVIDLLNDFNARMEARGARVLFAYPPIAEESYTHNQADIDLLDETLRERLDFPVINKPDGMLFPQEQFFDSSYHLKEPGVYDRTNRLIESLRPYLDQPAGDNGASPQL